MDLEIEKCRRAVKFFRFLTFALVLSCTNVKRAAKGPLGNGNYFEMLYFPYTDVGHHMKFRNCQVFNAQLKNNDNKIVEEFIWYSCDSSLPVKIYFTPSGESKKSTTVNVLMADTTAGATFPLTEEEQKTMWSMNTWFANHHYPTFPVRGFRAFSKEDSTMKMPFLKKVILLRYYGRK